MISINFYSPKMEKWISVGGKTYILQKTLSFLFDYLGPFRFPNRVVYDEHRKNVHSETEGQRKRTDSVTNSEISDTSSKPELRKPDTSK